MANVSVESSTILIFVFLSVAMVQEVGSYWQVHGLAYYQHTYDGACTPPPSPPPLGVFSCYLYRGFRYICELLVLEGFLRQTDRGVLVIAIIPELVRRI